MRVASPELLVVGLALAERVVGELEMRQQPAVVEHGRADTGAEGDDELEALCPLTTAAPCTSASLATLVGLPSRSASGRGQVEAVPLLVDQVVDDVRTEPADSVAKAGRGQDAPGAHHARGSRPRPGRTRAVAPPAGPGRRPASSAASGTWWRPGHGRPPSCRWRRATEALSPVPADVDRQGAGPLVGAAEVAGARPPRRSSGTSCARGHRARLDRASDDTVDREPPEHVVARRCPSARACTASASGARRRQPWRSRSGVSCKRVDGARGTATPRDAGRRGCRAECAGRPRGRRRPSPSPSPRPCRPATGSRWPGTPSRDRRRRWRGGRARWGHRGPGRR